MRTILRSFPSSRPERIRRVMFSGFNNSPSLYHSIVGSGFPVAGQLSRTVLFSIAVLQELWLTPLLSTTGMLYWLKPFSFKRLLPLEQILPLQYTPLFRIPFLVGRKRWLWGLLMKRDGRTNFIVNLRV